MHPEERWRQRTGGGVLCTCLMSMFRSGTMVRRTSVDHADAVEQPASLTVRQGAERTHLGWYPLTEGDRVACGPRTGRLPREGSAPRPAAGDRGASLSAGPSLKEPRK